jgi:hypothetical protein
MTIIEELLSGMKTDDFAEKIKTICDQISKEEGKKIKHFDLLPKGPNIFLSLEVPGRIQYEIAFLTLEREGPVQFITVLYTINKNEYTKKKLDEVSYKKSKVWEILEDKPEKILAAYAKQYKFLRGI